MKSSLEDLLIFIVSATLFFGTLGLSLWWVIYKYHDCIKVGHSTTYCVINIF